MEKANQLILTWRRNQRLSQKKKQGQKGRENQQQSASNTHPTIISAPMDAVQNVKTNTLGMMNKVAGAVSKVNGKAPVLPSTMKPVAAPGSAMLIP